MQEYKIGDTDTRPWGSYKVTDVGMSGAEEFCEKEITVLPRHVLSLQSHDFRREIWRVVSGTLTVIVDDRRLTLNAGEEVDVPLGAIHCMANVGNAPCVVFERQQGRCREEDIHRFADAYGRAGEEVTGDVGQKSLALYQSLLHDIQGINGG